MKKLLFICFLLSFGLIYAQTITEERKEYLLSQIKDTTDQNIVYEIKENKVQEAIPKLESFFWKQEQSRRYDFLTTLNTIGSTNIKSFANTYLDSLITGFCPECYWFEIFYTFAILFQSNDYAKIDLFFDLVDKKTQEYKFAYEALEILAKTPLYKERAREYLLKAMFSDYDYYDSRVEAFSSYKKAFGEDGIMSIHERIIKNIESNILSYFVFYYVPKYDEPDILSLLKERLAVETSVTCRYFISRAIILKYNNPINVDFLKHITNNDPLLKNKFESWLQKPEPIIINRSINVTQLTDSLINFHDQCESLHWLSNTVFSEQLKPYLLDAKTKLISGDSLGAAFKINQYQSAIVHAYQDPVTNTNQFVTPDGYKFLYYYPKYILERLPKLPIIKTITPAITVTKTKEFILSVEGNYFRPTSVISWNGEPCKTTFVSNTLLQTKIDLNDFEGREDKERKDGDEKKVKDGEITIPVWVTTNKWINTDTLTFRLYNKLQYPILPLLNCIVETYPTKYEAWFGYDNKNEGSVLLDHASENKFYQAPQDRGQPTVFLQGKHDKVFSVEFEGNKKLMWKLDKEKAEASKDSPRCK